MRNGDAYKIRLLITKQGLSDDEILERFKWDYPAEEIKKFCEVNRKPADAPAKPKRRRAATSEE